MYWICWWVELSLSLGGWEGNDVYVQYIYNICLYYICYIYILQILL